MTLPAFRHFVHTLTFFDRTVIDDRDLLDVRDSRCGSSRGASGSRCDPRCGCLPHTVQTWDIFGSTPSYALDVPSSIAAGPGGKAQTDASTSPEARTRRVTSAGAARTEYLYGYTCRVTTRRTAAATSGRDARGALHARHAHPRRADGASRGRVASSSGTVSGARAAWPRTWRRSRPSPRCTTSPLDVLLRDLNALISEGGDHVSDIAGAIQIHDDVLADIAGFAALEQYGVVGMASPSLRDGVAQLLSRDKLRKGVVITHEDDGVHVDLYVVVEYGTNLTEVSRNLADKVALRARRATRTSRSPRSTSTSRTSRSASRPRTGDARMTDSLNAGRPRPHRSRLPRRSRSAGTRSTVSTCSRCPTATPARTCRSRWMPSSPSSAKLPPERRQSRTICHAVTQGSLMGARGNSGVILSQILRGLCAVLADVAEVTPQARRRRARERRRPSRSRPCASRSRARC